jgi:hypothetical protein
MLNLLSTCPGAELDASDGDYVTFVHSHVR